LFKRFTKRVKEKNKLDTLQIAVKQQSMLLDRSSNEQVWHKRFAILYPAWRI